MSEPLTQVAGEESRWTSTVAVHYDAKRPLSRYIRWYLLPVSYTHLTLPTKA